MKKLLSVALSLCLAIGSFAALAPLTACAPAKKESVEILIKVPTLSVDSVAYPDVQSSDAMLKTMWNSFAAQYDKYDVSLRDDTVNSFAQTEYAENITNAYGTENCPDLSFGGYFAMSGYMYDGYMVPLDDIITPEIRSDISEATWKLSKGSNGKTYMMPFYALQNILCYNKDLFREYGLEKYAGPAANAASASASGSAATSPTSKNAIQGWSLEEWETIFSTLQKNLPSGKYPMLMYAKNNQGDTHTMVQLRVKGSKFFNDEGLFNLNTPEGIAGLQWIKDNYDKGYYPKDCENLEISDNSEMFNTGQLGFYIWNSALASKFEGMDLGYVNFPSDTPKGANSNWITGFMAFDNGDAKKIEVVKDFLKYIYSTPELTDFAAGGVPCLKSVTERWKEKIPFETLLAANDENSVDFTGNNPNWSGVRAAFWPHIQALLSGKETAAQAAAGLDADCNKAIMAATRKLHD